MVRIAVVGTGAIGAHLLDAFAGGQAGPAAPTPLFSTATVGVTTGHSASTGESAATGSAAITTY